MRSGQFLSETGVTGAGMTVGVQSSGLNSLSNIQARGELPAARCSTPAGNSTPVPGDEGTVLLEEVHAVAPGASLIIAVPRLSWTTCPACRR